MDQVLEKEINEYTKLNQHVSKYKHKHIGGNDLTLDFRTINLEEKCTFSNKVK